jgi:DNA-directed RNA polymerase specialized sigma24 family protein
MQAVANIDEGENLNTLFRDYLHGCITRKEMEGKLFIYIKMHPRRFSISLFKNESRDDFISWLYPRLSRAIDNYTDQGSCFNAYITTMVRLSAKEYCLRKKEHRIIERTWWDAKAIEMEVMEEEPLYFDTKPLLEKAPNPRQILMLLLKSYYFLSDEHLEQLAPAVGLHKEELYQMVDKLRVIRVQREEAINSFKERIHGQFYRCLAFEKRLQAAALDSAHWYKMKRCLETARKRLASMRRRFNTMRIEASNEQVAEIMGVAKGTIDSNLHVVRKNNLDKL